MARALRASVVRPRGERCDTLPGEPLMRRGLKRTLAAAMVTIAGLASTPAQAWQAMVPTSVPKAPGLEAMTVDGRGDVVAAVVAGRGASFAIVKLQRGSGRILWRHRLIGRGREHYDEASGLATDTAGDVVVGAQVEDAGKVNFTVAKLSGTTGRERWRHVVHGAAPPYGDRAYAVAVDPAGDMVAAGRLTNVTVPGNYGDFAVVKLAGASGEELWRYVEQRAGEVEGEATTVAIDSAGDVVAGGETGITTAPGHSSDFVNAVKLAGGDGHLLWQATVDEALRAQALALDPQGNAYIATAFLGSNAYVFGVAALSATSGAIRWRAQVSPAGNEGGQANQVAVDPAGDVVAAGFSQTSATGGFFTVAKFAGSDGTERWQQTVHGNHPRGGNWANAVVVDSSGDVIAAGSLENRHTCYDFAMVQLSGATGEVMKLRSLDGTATATVCDYQPYCGDSGPCAPQPPRAGIDNDEADFAALGPHGTVVVGGMLSDWRDSSVHRDTFVLAFAAPAS